MRLAFLLAGALMQFVNATSAHAQKLLSESCGRFVIDAENTKQFLQFDREFRKALESADPAMLALLAAYPLRINDQFGSWSISDGESFAGRYRTIFTPAVRDAVLKTSVNRIVCSVEGIAYGNGMVNVWVDEKKFDSKTHRSQYLIQTINLSSNPPRSNPQTVQFVCRTKDHEVLVDRNEAGRLRYRAWDYGHSIMEKPDLEITGGETHSEGHDVCAYWVWTFKQSSFVYEVDGLGCANAPSTAIGSLQVLQGETVKTDSWCY